METIPWKMSHMFSISHACYSFYPHAYPAPNLMCPQYSSNAASRPPSHSSSRPITALHQQSTVTADQWEAGLGSCDQRLQEQRRLAVGQGRPFGGDPFPLPTPRSDGVGKSGQSNVNYQPDSHVNHKAPTSPVNFFKLYWFSPKMGAFNQMQPFLTLKSSFCRKFPMKTALFRLNLVPKKPPSTFLSYFSDWLAGFLVSKEREGIGRHNGCPEES